jgi:integrase
MATVFKRGGTTNREGYWYVSWFEYNGNGRVRRTKCTKTTDKATAERIANKYEADAALRREGVIDPALDSINRESRRTIEAHLADYENMLRAAGCGDKHVTHTIGFIRRIAKAGSFAVAADVSADGVGRYAASLKDEGRSARTIQAHLTAIKGFSKWLYQGVKLPRDPLASVKKPNPKADRRRERRMLLVEEWHRVVAATRSGPTRFGVSAVERLLLYRTAIQTGLRSGELRSLTRGRLFLDARSPYITCKAGSTKNRKDARQYIAPELAADLRLHVATKLPKAPVFNMPHAFEVADMLRDDVEQARNAWLREAEKDPDEYKRREQSDFLAGVNHEGEALDFHSLRHSCGAWLAMTGAHPKVVQQVMRHSSITLTMDTYGHLFPGQEVDAVAKLHELMVQRPALAAVAAG